MRFWTRVPALSRNRLPQSSRPRRFRPALEVLEERWLPSTTAGFAQINLASDLPGVARFVDPTLGDPWGLSNSPSGPFWVSENYSGVADILNGIGQVNPLVVTVPAVSGPTGSPTGTVFNGGQGFVIAANGVSSPAAFLFATLDGAIYAWNGYIGASNAVLAVNNSSSGSVYTGLALATNPLGQSFLYAADAANGAIDVFDQNFQELRLPGAFHDPNLPAGFTPFNIQNIDGQLYVTYANFNGAGSGIIDIYDTAGNLVQRFASEGALNSPWGLAVAPANFGPFGGDLLVGNNGDGRISAYDLQTGAYRGQLYGDNGAPITIPSLWAISFGNGHAAGDSNTLFFTAGIDEEDGIFGAIQSPQMRGATTAGPGAFDPNGPGEPANYPLPPFGGPTLQDANDPPASTAVLLPLSGSAPALVPTLSSYPQFIATASTPAPTTPIAALSFNSAFPAAFLASVTTVLVPSGDDFLPQTDGRGATLALDTFLDLHPIEASTAIAPEVQVAVAEPASSDDGDSPAVDRAQQPASAISGQSILAADVDSVALVSVDSVALASPELIAADGNDWSAARDDSQGTPQLRSVLIAMCLPLLSGYLVSRWRRSRQTDKDGKSLLTKQVCHSHQHGSANEGQNTVPSDVVPIAQRDRTLSPV